MREPNSILSRFGTTIFTTMSDLARQHEAINLGQGFPDDPGPSDVRALAAREVRDGYNQYPPSRGLPELRDAVASHNKRFYGIEVNGTDNVLVTSGATEALASALFGLLDAGDEVVLIEPLYDSYLPIIEMIGAVPRFVRLSPPHWQLPMDQLKAAFSDKTKAVLLNSPMNPNGKVFKRKELQAIADLCVAHDAYAICDEVYEHLTFELPHIPLMTFEGMAERTVRIGSAGKTFSLTGWKIGYLTACAPIIDAISRAHQFLTFTTAPNLQKAVAFGLQKSDDYFFDLARELQAKRDRLTDGLRSTGMKVLGCDGTYFLTVDFSDLGFDGDDTAFCETITTQAKVAAVPMSAFYAPQRASGIPLDQRLQQCARFCFAKNDDVIDEAVSRLARFMQSR